jgi:hypothetical protein
MTPEEHALLGYLVQGYQLWPDPARRGYRLQSSEPLLDPAPTHSYPLALVERFWQVQWIKLEAGRYQLTPRGREQYAEHLPAGTSAHPQWEYLQLSPATHPDTGEAYPGQWTVSPLRLTEYRDPYAPIKGSLVEALNEVGASGWEVVQSVNEWNFLLKRRKVPPCAP